MTDNHTEIWSYQYSPYTLQDGKETELSAYEIYNTDGDKIADTNENQPDDYQRKVAAFLAVAPQMLGVLKDAAFLAECLWHLQGNDEARKLAEKARAVIANAEGGAA